MYCSCVVVAVENKIKTYDFKSGKEATGANDIFEVL